MRNVLTLSLGLLAVIALSPWGWAAEHGGKEHGGAPAQAQGGKEHGGTMADQPMTKTPSNEDIRSAMQSHVGQEAEKTGGNFEVLDPDTNTTRRLSLIRVHERVGKTGNYYYSCADFMDVDSGEMLDLDLDVEDQNGRLQVVDVRVHKVGGIERYTYDANDNRIPLGDTKSHLGKAGSEATQEHGEATQEHGGATQEHGGATQEHGGKEHGGM